MNAAAPDIATQLAAARAAEGAGDLDGAEQILRDGLAADPGDGDAIFALAEFLTRCGRTDEAEPLYRRLLAAFPDQPALLNSVGVMLHKAARRDEAVGIWRRVLATNPNLTAPLVNLGLALRDAGDAVGAAAHFERAIALEPKLVDAHFNLGLLHHLARRHGAAIDSFETVLRLQLDHARAAALLAQSSLAICDWARVDRLTPMLRDEVAKATEGRPCAVTIRLSLLLPFDGPSRKAVAAVAARGYEHAGAACAPGFRFDPGPRERLTIGYMAADFRDHPIFHLTAGLYRRHDRARFNIRAYPVRRPEPVAQAALADCDAVVDLSAAQAEAAARRIYDDKVDLLVDISGFTQFARPEILALRPAPIQVAWLGTPGTQAGKLYDYMIGDRIITPPDRAGDYLETLALAPHSYQVNNRDQEIAPAPPRAAEGLPDDAFVFASFCGGEKIDRETFGCWMTILARTPGSVLWLYGEAPKLHVNLRDAARARDVDPARLVFARTAPKARHLGRMTLADLHLDTGIYGAHTTASDALWAGVPHLTRLGDGFPARVGASVLTAIGLPELVATDWDSYVRIATEFAADRARAASIRRKLAVNRLTTPLFDTDASARGLEALYRKMWSRFAAGLQPAPLDV